MARNGEPQVVNDARSDPRHSTEIADQVGYHPRSVLCVPLRLGDGQGALELLNKAHGRSNFTDDDLKLAIVIAGHVSTRSAWLRRASDASARSDSPPSGSFCQASSTIYADR